MQMIWMIWIQMTMTKVTNRCALFSATLEFPYNLSESEVQCLASAFLDISNGHIAKRIDQNDSKPWFVQWYFDSKPEKADLASRLAIQARLFEKEINASNLIIAPIEDKNWLEEVYAELKPFSVGPFFIYGSHYDGSVPTGQIGLCIDAATAFGSGDHGTTKGCLQAMLDLKGKGICPWNVLDMGTGSGILSVAVWKLWQTPITAVDIEEESVRVAQKYRDMNDVPSHKTGMTCETGDGFETPIVQRKKPYDLVIANILAGPLIKMAPDLKAICDNLGYIILSGMLKTQADDVLKTYEGQNLKFVKRIDIDKWTTLVLQNP